MSKRNSLSPKAYKWSQPLILTTAILFTLNGWAQQDSENSDSDQAQLDRVTVTGSRIARSQLEGPSPVVVITAEDMEEQGYATAQDALDSLVQNTGGSIDQSFTFGFTPAASAVNLRGFGNGRALVLLDGRRLPIYPVAASGTNNFVDLSQVPQSQIERIEVLTDGASAIYGSDAVSGVINIITRKDYEGMSLNLRLGDTSDGGFGSERAQLFAGTTNGTTSMSASIEYWHNDPLWARDRDYAGSDIANPRGAYSVGGSSFVNLNTGAVTQAPGCGTPNGPLGGLGIPNQNVPIFNAGDTWCSFNRTAFRQLWPEDERKSVSFRIDHELTDNVSAFARFGYLDRKTETQLEPNFYGGFLFGTAPATANTIAPLTAANWGVVAAGAPNNPDPSAPGVFIRRLVEFGARQSDIQNNGIQGVVGLKGSFGSENYYDWELGLAYNKTDIVIERPNIISSVFNELVSNGLDLFQPIPTSVVNQASFLSTRDSESDNIIADFTISGDTPWSIQSRPIAFSAHVDYEEQSFINTADSITLNGDAFDGGSAGGGSRDHLGAGFEVNFPVLDQLDINLAMRYDDYNDQSDVGSAVSPRLSLAWRPTRDVLVRATAGESFRAPDLQRLFGATTRGFQTVNDPVTGLQVQSVSILTGANIALEEEKGENFNIGVVWEPIENLSLIADAYHIELEGIVTTLTPQFILNSCGAAQTGLFCNLVTRDAQGTLQGGNISSNAQNLSFQEITGLDLTVDYAWQTDNAGRFDTELTVAYVDSLKTQLSAASAITENIGLNSLPEYRANLTLGWNRENLGSTVRVQWVGELCGVNGGANNVNCLANEFIDPYTLVNWTGTYDFGENGRLLIGLNNVFDADPSDDPTNNNWPWFFNNGGFSNPIGREYYVSYTFEFN